MSLFAELKRRNVVRVGIAYLVIGWFLAQVAEFAFENLGAPEWVLKSIVMILLFGLPLALFLAWAFEIAPEGVKRDEAVDRSQSVTHSTGRKLDSIIIGTLVLALGYSVWERQSTPNPVDDTDTVVVAERSEVADGEQVPDDGPVVRSIAVLPFVNMSSDQEQEWFSDGLIESFFSESLGPENPGRKKGIRIGSAKTSQVHYFLEDIESRDFAHSGAEGVDALGNVYGGVVRRRMLERHEPQAEQPTRGAAWAVHGGSVE